MSTQELPGQRQAYREHYASFHQDTAEYRAEQSRSLQRILAPVLPPDKRAAVLDIGCGWGFALSAIRDLGYANAEGIDTDREQVDVCVNAGLAATNVDDSEAFLASRKAAFDAVLMTDVLEHVPVDHQIALLSGIYHALRRGGRLILRVPNANHPFAARLRYIDFTHVCSFTEQSLRYACRCASFERVWFEPSPPLKRPSLRLWRADRRREFFPDLFMYMWREVLRAEMYWEDTSQVPFGVNLFAVAYKESA